jgi:hypothetical protein
LRRRRTEQQLDSAPLVELARRLGRGDVALGQRRLALWRELFLPEPPSHVRRPVPVWTPDPAGGGRWTRRSRKIDVTPLLAQHFAGEIALGGVYCAESRVLVLDLDNAAGKHTRIGARARLDPDLDDRRRLASLVAPRGLWVRSSASGGLHRWVFLSEALPIEKLALLAHARLRDIAEKLEGPLLSPLQLLELSTRAHGGIRGFEILPRTSRDSQGDTVRAPLGPGSAILTESGHPLEDPVEALEYVERFLARGGRISPEQLFSGHLTTQLVLAPATSPTRKETLTPPHRQVLGFEARIRTLAARCDGRLPEELRASPADVRDVALHLRAHGPAPGTRHYSTCILIYDCILDGLPKTLARERLFAWLRQVAPRGSRDARERLDEALADTARLIRFYYRQRKPPSGGFKPRPPAKLRRPDLVRLRARVSSGRAVGLAGRILEHVRTNGLRIADTHEYYCELPVTLLGISHPADRQARDELQAAGLLSLVRPAVPKLDERYRLGPRPAKAALWRIRWAYADSGAVLPPVERLYPRRNQGQAALLTRDDPVFGSPRSGGVGVPGCERSASRLVQPVDAVASKELVGGASKLDFNDRRPQLRQDEQDPRASIEQGSSSFEGRLRGARGEDERIVASLAGSMGEGRCLSRPEGAAWLHGDRGATPRDVWERSWAFFARPQLARARGPPEPRDDVLTPDVDRAIADRARELTAVRWRGIRSVVAHVPHCVLRRGYKYGQ